jgi:hypothetical protein
MAEIDPIEEKALPYLLDELSETEAREFERRMEGSAKLAERVRELEEGAAAVALACPAKRLPKQIWNNIERHIQTERRVIVWWEWFRGKGWAAAAACLVGWFLYALFTARSRSIEQGLSPSRLASHREQAALTNGVTSGGGGRPDGVTVVRREKFVRTNNLAAAPIELLTLRTQVAQLRGQVAQISQAVTQQQALLNDPARLKFLGLAPVSNGSVISTNGLSPQLQHAIGLAMARELGWLAGSNVSMGANSDELTHGSVTNIGGVDFVDLRPQQSTNSGAPNPLKAPVDLTPANDGNLSESQDSSTNTIGIVPAFASNDHVTLALDNSVGAAGSQVTLAAFPANGTPQVIGSTTLGGNPLVITFSSDCFSGGESTALFQGVGAGFNLIVTTVSPSGTSNQVQFTTTAP